MPLAIESIDLSCWPKWSMTDCAVVFHAAGNVCMNTGVSLYTLEVEQSTEHRVVLFVDMLAEQEEAREKYITKLP